MLKVLILLTAAILIQSKEEPCQCTPYYLCNNNSTTGIFKSSGDSGCESSREVCCHKRVKREDATPKKCGYTYQEEFPWIVTVQSRSEYLCPGSLIHPQVVLTTAHCVHRKNNDLAIHAENGQEKSVTYSKMHPYYFAPGLHNDVALLFLESPMELSPNLGVACLPSFNVQMGQEECFSAGWRNGTHGQEKFQADFPLVDRRTCQGMLKKTKLGKKFKLHRSFICASGEEGKCMDGGSALMCPMEEEDRMKIVGLASWGVGCGENGAPGAYTNLPIFRKWIEEECSRRGFFLHRFQD